MSSNFSDTIFLDFHVQWKNYSKASIIGSETLGSFTCLVVWNQREHIIIAHFYIMLWLSGNRILPYNMKVYFATLIHQYSNKFQKYIHEIRRLQCFFLECFLVCACASKISATCSFLPFPLPFSYLLFVIQKLF